MVTNIGAAARKEACLKAEDGQLKEIPNMSTSGEAWLPWPRGQWVLTSTEAKKDRTIVVHDVKGPAATVRAKLTTPAEKIKGFGGTLLLDKGEVRRITDKEVWALQGGAEDVWTKLLEEGFDATDLLTEIARQMPIYTAKWLVEWAERIRAGIQRRSLESIQTGTETRWTKI